MESKHGIKHIHEATSFYEQKETEDIKPEVMGNNYIAVTLIPMAFYI